MAIVEPDNSNPNNSPLNKTYCCYIEFPPAPHTDYNGGWWGINPPPQWWEESKWPDMFPETYPTPKDKTPIWTAPYIEPHTVDKETEEKWQKIFNNYYQKNMINPEWKQNGQYYSSEFQVPGFKKEHVTIELKERVLSLKASREDGKYTDRVKTLTLPSDADETNIAAKVEDGILAITVAKIAPPVAKKIVVN